MPQDVISGTGRSASLLQLTESNQRPEHLDMPIDRQQPEVDDIDHVQAD
jgi:hypothetical protein